MDPACLEYCLTNPERDELELNGFLIVEDVLPPRLIEELSAVVDRLDQDEGLLPLPSSERYSSSVPVVRCESWRFA